MTNRKWTKEDENLLRNLQDKKRDAEIERDRILEDFIQEHFFYEAKEQAWDVFANNTDELIAVLTKYKEYGDEY